MLFLRLHIPLPFSSERHFPLPFPLSLFFPPFFLLMSSGEHTYYSVAIDAITFLPHYSLSYTHYSTILYFMSLLSPYYRAYNIFWEPFTCPMLSWIYTWETLCLFIIIRLFNMKYIFFFISSGYIFFSHYEFQQHYERHLFFIPSFYAFPSFFLLHFLFFMTFLCLSWFSMTEQLTFLFSFISYLITENTRERENILPSNMSHIATPFSFTPHLLTASLSISLCAPAPRLPPRHAFSPNIVTLLTYELTLDIWRYIWAADDRCHLFLIYIVFAFSHYIEILSSNRHISAFRRCLPFKFIEWRAAFDYIHTYI